MSNIEVRIQCTTGERHRAWVWNQPSNHPLMRRPPTYLPQPNNRTTDRGVAGARAVVRWCGGGAAARCSDRRGRFHALFHNTAERRESSDGNYSHIGAHAFSLDGRSWQLSPHGAVAYAAV